MFYAVIKTPTDNEPKANLYFFIREYYRDTFSPDAETIALIGFGVHGKTYAERKAYLTNLALEWTAADTECQGGGLSFGEYAFITNWFAKMGKRYGLLQEFRENGIC